MMPPRVGPLAISRALLTEVAPLQRIALALDLLTSIDDPEFFRPIAEAIRDADKHAQKLARRAFGLEG